ncbi:5-(carboxyamino)imidazole ribonucleotide mutase [bacterium]|nr:5-(carboxyamino)imidazole ribonucleotide mutase [bacterium]RQV92073.1 MAG: 5-(carboxyamino)imidazole ribonucleotide mutase [bacterium]
MAFNKDVKVAVLMGSQSDETVMQHCVQLLQYFGIPHEVHVMSAHRHPDKVTVFAQSIDEKDIHVVIAGAGMAAHLPGVLASQTTVPVIGVPLEGSSLGGQDALFSMVQMPSGIPVATMAIGKTGAQNAAILAAEILALRDNALKKKLIAFRKQGSKI